MITFFFQFALLSHKSSSHVNFEACMIAKRAVCILMECFLVYISVYGVRICDFLTWRLLRKVSLKRCLNCYTKFVEGRWTDITDFFPERPGTLTRKQCHLSFWDCGSKNDCKLPKRNCQYRLSKTILNRFENVNAFETIYFCILYCFGFRIQTQ